MVHRSILVVLNQLLTCRTLLAVACLSVVSPVELHAQSTQDAVKAELHAYQANGDYELAILAILDSIQAGALERAIEQADAHLLKFPKSQVGHLLRADALSALTGELDSVAANGAIPSAYVAGLTHQIRNRWKHRSVHEPIAHQQFPASLLVMGQTSDIS